MKTTPIAMAVVVACLLAGCSGGSMTGQVASGTPTAAEPAIKVSLPVTPVTAPGAGFNLPAPSQFKDVSYIEEDLYRVGSDTVDFLSSQHALPDGDNMIFSPNWDRGFPDDSGLAFAAYQFLMDGYDRDESARFSWAQSDDFHDGYVALADWYEDRWDWYRLPEGNICALDFTGCLKLSDNSLLMVVLLTGHGSWHLENVRIGAPPGAPQPPENIEASDGEFVDKILVTWDKPFGATGYILYRDDQLSPIDTIGDVTSYEDYLDDKQPHDYWVIATNDDGPSGFSQSDTGWCAACLPPTDVVASDGLFVDRIEVTWTKAEEVDGYEIYRDSLELPIAIVGDENVWADYGVVDSGAHNYKLKSFNLIGKSNFSATDGGFLGSPTPPVAPTNLRASDGLYIDKVELTWNIAENTIGYEIYRDLQALPIETVGDIDTWDDTTLIDNEPHTYWLKSINASGSSEFSNSDTGHLAACDPPTEVAASDGDYSTKIVITWVKSADATGYKVYRDSRIQPPIAVLGDVDTYDDVTIVDSGPHTYWVKGYTDTGDSAFSNADSGYMRELVVPSTPTNVQASDGTFIDRVEITWEAVEDAGQYKIYRDLQIAPIATVGPVTSYSDTGLANYDPHEYWVIASNVMGDSDYSESDTGYMGTPTSVPDPPTGLQASDGDYNDKIRLNWTTSPGATGYKIYRDSQAAPIDTVENVGSYDDTGIVDYSEHTYWVKAVNIVGDSDFSNSDTGYMTPEGNPPAAPTNLQASDGTHADRIVLTWEKPVGATGYRIFRDIQTAPIEVVGDVDTWDDTGVSDLEVHTYWIRGTNEHGFGDFSESDTGYLLAP